MPEPCRHVPPCATPAVHRGAQRAGWRKALAAAARGRRNGRGKRPPPGVPGVRIVIEADLPGLREGRLPAPELSAEWTARRPPAGGGP